MINVVTLEGTYLYAHFGANGANCSAPIVLLIPLDGTTKNEAYRCESMEENFLSSVGNLKAVHHQKVDGTLFVNQSGLRPYSTNTKTVMPTGMVQVLLSKSWSSGGVLCVGEGTHTVRLTSTSSGMGVSPINRREEFTSYGELTHVVRVVGHSVVVESSYSTTTVWATSGSYKYPSAPKRQSGRIDVLKKRIIWDTGSSKTLTQTCRFDGVGAKVARVAARSIGKFANLFTSDQGELARRCAQRVPQNDVNMISYVKEVPGLPKMVAQTIRALGNLDNPKTWADLFLSGKYGWSMSLRDTLAIHDHILDVLSGWPRVRHCVYASDSTGDGGSQTTNRYLIRYSHADNSPASQLKRIMDAGFWPSLSNLWDLVPWSFVINWVTGFDGILKAIDDGFYLDVLPITGVCSSSKCVGTIPAEALPTNIVGGSLTFSVYERRPSTYAHRPKIQLDEVSLAGLASHTVEAAALVTQKLLK